VKELKIAFYAALALMFAGMVASYFVQPGQMSEEEVRAFFKN